MDKTGRVPCPLADTSSTSAACCWRSCLRSTGTGLNRRAGLPVSMSTTRPSASSRSIDGPTRWCSIPVSRPSSRPRRPRKSWQKRPPPDRRATRWPWFNSRNPWPNRLSPPPHPSALPAARRLPVHPLRAWPAPTCLVSGIRCPGDHGSRACETCGSIAAARCTFALSLRNGMRLPDLSAKDSYRRAWGYLYRVEPLSRSPSSSRVAQDGNDDLRPQRCRWAG